MLNDALTRVENVRNILYEKGQNELAEELNQAHYSIQLSQEE